MKLTTLYTFMLVQLWRNPMIRIFAVVGVCGLVWLSVVREMPSLKLVEDLCFIFIPVYFIVATGGNIIETTDRPTIELLLAKPFSRRDIVVADYLSVTSIFGLGSLAISMGLWLVFGWRGGEGGLSLVALFLSLQLSFMSLYCFIQLSGLLLRNAALVVVAWVGYIYFGVALIEACARWVSSSGGMLWQIIFYPVYYVPPRVLGIYRSIQGGFGRGDWEIMPIMSSALSGALALAAAIFFLDRRDIGSG